MIVERIYDGLGGQAIWIYRGMPRGRRFNIRGATYHVMNRGNRKAIIFEDERDRRRFLRILLETTAEYQVAVLIGVLLGNHFHLVVQTPHGNLSEFMQQLEGQYAQFSNWRHSRIGHLFQDRFKAVIIENDIHLFTAFWYVAMNPVTAGFVRRPEEWIWSSYASTVGLRPVPDYLSVTWLETVFPAGSTEESQQLCRQCMSDPQPIQAYLQSAEPNTAASIRSYVSERLREVSQPCPYGILMRPPIDHLFPVGQTKTERQDAITRAHEVHGFKLAEIAKSIGLHYSNVSKIYSSVRKARRLKSGSDPELGELGD